MYRVPDEYYCRLHHVRPRFKRNIENVLVFMANEIAKLNEMDADDFKERVNLAVRMFPGNAIAVEKTINNWRTEISSLFGFIQYNNYTDTSKPGLRAKELADKQDLVQSLKIFLYFFQYPGGHIKSHENARYIAEGVRFKPAQFILRLLDYAEKTEGVRVGITKPEITHCVFNDLRCTRGTQDLSEVWQRIKLNRRQNVTYDSSGDVVRYAGDILDYMEIANLLVSHGPLFYINSLERLAIEKFICSDKWFAGYDRMISNRRPDAELLRQSGIEWFNYVNQPVDQKFFETDILAFISSDQAEYEKLVKLTESLERRFQEAETPMGTKEIGDWGEALVHGHECMRVKIGGREDLIHLIKPIPTQYAVGYDLQSVELDTQKRYIEVKTTISSRPIDFNKFHLTPNEWSTATSVGDRYYVYRLYLSKHSRSLFLIQDPVRKYKEDKIQMTLRDGADIIFKPEKCGYYEELLTWDS